MVYATLVRDNSTLAAALERLRGAQRLALDTEFMRESTCTRHARTSRS